MLILVGVTINLAANGGLFEKSRTASKDTEQKKILEELIAMAEFDNDGKINVDSLIEKVGAKYDGSRYDQTNSKLTVKGNKGDFYYKVTDTEIKIWEDNNSEDGTIPSGEDEIVGKYIDIKAEIGESEEYEITDEKIISSEEDMNAEYSYDSENKIITFTNTTKKGETTSYRMKMHFIKNDEGKTINIIALPPLEDMNNEELRFLMLSKNGYVGFEKYMLPEGSYNSGTLKLGIGEDKNGNKYGTWECNDGTFIYLYMDNYMYATYGFGSISDENKFEVDGKIYTKDT